MKNFLIIVLLTASACAVCAQDNLGIIGSSRSPANSVLINPSSISDSRAIIDFNLVGLGVFARNNLVYIPGKAMSIKGLSSLENVPVNRSNDPYSAYVDAIVHGPSLTFAVKKHAFGIYSAARVVADARGLPENMSYYVSDGLQYPGQMGIQQQVKNLRSNALGWGEVGFTYATILKAKGNTLWQGGITAKRLFGVAGAGLRLDDWTYVVTDSTNLQTSVFRGEYGFNDPTVGQSPIQGKGWGFDLGITYKVRKSNSEGYTPHDPCSDGDYLYKVGVSLLDFGKVNFTGPFYRNVFDQTESAEWEGYAGTTADGMSDLDSLINSNFNLVQKNGREQKFGMKLPAAISAQVDYNLGKNFYLLGIATIGLPRLNSLGPQRASYVGLVPRWEIKRIEFAMPLSLYEWKTPQMGLAMRLNSFVLGSDNLGTMLLKKDVYGADIYLNFKYTMFKHWKCKGPKKTKSVIKKKTMAEPVPCAAW